MEDKVMSPELQAKPSVLIVGGGVAGLSVAHELARAGTHRITVLEQEPICGGKARTMRVPDGNPIEHAMRIYPPSYEHLFTIMKEIPFGTATTYDNLQYGTFRINYGDRSIALQFRYTNFLSHVGKAARLMWFFFVNGVTTYELFYFVFKVGRLLWLTEEEINWKLEPISFENYLGGKDRTPAFQNLVLRLPEMFVAAKRHSSAAVVTRVFLEFFVGPFLRGKHARLGIASLNGPTSERFIEPWVEHLRSLGVTFVQCDRVQSLTERARRIDRVRTDGGTDYMADAFVLALPHNILRALLGDLIDRSAGLEELEPLGEEWANGVQFALKAIPDDWRPFVGCTTVAANSPWSLDFVIYTRETWPGVPLPDGTAGILSIAASNSINLGVVVKRPFNRCNERELLDEMLVQTGLSAHTEVVTARYISPDLKYLSADEFLAGEARYAGYGARSIGDGKQVLVSDCLLYVRLPGNAAIEPDNRTEIDNLFIAGEFTSTLSKMPSMEKSCESGMRCAAAIMQDAGAGYDLSRLGLSELPLRILRNLRFRFWTIAATGLFVVALIGVVLKLTLFAH
jgi:uncharacterized protein with NAD-binding domain and iron-sulfur cluster